jgi:hypothetical protein
MGYAQYPGHALAHWSRYGELVFTAHDAGHMGITHNFHVDTVIGMFIADYLGV